MRDEVFFHEYVVLEKGDLVELPVFSLALEHKVRRKVIHAFDSLPEERQGTLSTNFFSFRTFRALMLESPGLLSDLGVDLYGKPEEWVKGNVTAAEIIGQLLARLSPKKSDAEVKGDGWPLSRTIEFLQHEYKWTVPQVMSHSRDQIGEIMEACAERYEEQNRASEGKKPMRNRRSSEPVERGIGSLENFASNTGITIKEEATLPAGYEEAINA